MARLVLGILAWEDCASRAAERWLQSRSPFECVEEFPGCEHVQVEHAKAGEVLISGDRRVDLGGPCQSHQLIVVRITTDGWHFDRVVEQLSASVQLRHELTGLVEDDVAPEPFAGEDPTDLAQQVRRGHKREPVGVKGQRAGWLGSHRRRSDRKRAQQGQPPPGE